MRLAALTAGLATAVALLAWWSPRAGPADRLGAMRRPAEPPIGHTGERRTASAMAAPVRFLARHGRRKRMAAARAEAVVELAGALAAELRAGQPPAAALAAVADAGGPLAAELREIAGLTRTGVPVAAELRRVAGLPGAAALASIAAVWEVTEAHGGPVADVLDRLGEALDAEAAARRALEATLAGPRATMLLLLTLPALGIALGESTGAHPLELLVHQPVGWALVAGAAVLDAVGVAWTRRLLRSVTGT